MVEILPFEMYGFTVRLLCQLNPELKARLSLEAVDNLLREIATGESCLAHSPAERSGYPGTHQQAMAELTQRTMRGRIKRDKIMAAELLRWKVG